ncbi:MAG: PHP domain-containing protein [Desulfobacterales bacterium]
MGCDVPRRIDLHIHSTASDGSCTPSEILSLAEKLNLGAIAITDHDTIEGCVEAIEKGIPASLQFLTGVEISSNPPIPLPSSGSLHILGYGIETDNPELNRALSILRKARKNRNPEILKRLESFGIDLSIDEIQKKVGTGQIGRPHIAQAMLAMGVVKTINEAFERYLGKDRPAYIDKYRIACEKAIELIRNADGIPVLAHPGLIKTGDLKELKHLVSVLKEMGLMGIEVFYTDHSQNQSVEFQKIALHHDLLLTGGTDFHGKMLPDIQMGSGRGDMVIPYEIYENLMARLSRHSNHAK